MKKFIVLGLSVSLCGLTACGSDSKPVAHSSSVSTSAASSKPSQTPTARSTPTAINLDAAWNRYFTSIEDVFGLNIVLGKDGNGGNPDGKLSESQKIELKKRFDPLNCGDVYAFNEPDDAQAINLIASSPDFPNVSFGKKIGFAEAVVNLCHQPEIKAQYDKAVESVPPLEVEE